jgi:hypothetical protein
MEKGLSLTHPMEWETPVSESAVEREAGPDGGIRFFRGMVVAGLISLPFWIGAGWLLLTSSGK